MSGKSLPSSERSGPEVALLRVGQPVDGIYACVRKERQLSRSGTPYLAAELRDATGLIAARAFRDADVLAGRFERGDLVRVRGLVKDWGGRPQVELRSIERVDAATVDPASFLPASRRDLDELEGFLEHLAREVFDPPLAALLRALLGDRKLRAELRRAPCTMPPSRSDGGGGAPRAGTHHAYLGGLLEHTVAVATLAVELCAVHTRLDRDMLLTAAIVHDLGRTREFTYGAEIGRTDAGRMLGHITLGLRVVGEHAPASLEDQRRLALEHCVMLHHGEDPAAGRRFASAEAVALHRLNALDAQVKGALEGAVAR
ncbi:MAG: HD domain-containing protein [Acidobacteriota bacterium]|nr:HD domain-containing protein [Acidobacteriota bacterium]